MRLYYGMRCGVWYYGRILSDWVVVLVGGRVVIRIGVGSGFERKLRSECIERWLPNRRSIAHATSQACLLVRFEVAVTLV